MSKSDLLDEMRMEVGLAHDYSKSLYDFYEGVIHTLEKRWHYCVHSAIFENTWLTFESVGDVSLLPFKREMTIAESPFHLCAMRGKTTAYFKKDQSFLFVPFFNGQLLQGVLVLETRSDNYVIQEEDFIFLNEISNFIGAVSSQF
ncbi:hypothetical protein [Alteribacillus sp. HJP-4]|uniref:hypothetical protein n=1 Tax=Alteribacillus sp. HJP-4 TaxID=2775394 RepID=UPI0035CD1D8C